MLLSMCWLIQYACNLHHNIDKSNIVLELWRALYHDGVEYLFFANTGKNHFNTRVELFILIQINIFEF